LQIEQKELRDFEQAFSIAARNFVPGKFGLNRFGKSISVFVPQSLQIPNEVGTDDALGIYQVARADKEAVNDVRGREGFVGGTAAGIGTTDEIPWECALRHYASFKSRFIRNLVSSEQSIQVLFDRDQPECSTGFER